MMDIMVATLMLAVGFGAITFVYYFSARDEEDFRGMLKIYFIIVALYPIVAFSIVLLNEWHGG